MCVCRCVPRLDRSPRERRIVIRFGFECVQQFGYSPQFIELLANICAALGCLRPFPPIHSL